MALVFWGGGGGWRVGEIHALEAGSNTAVIVIARAGLGRVRAAGRGAAGEGVFDKAVHSGLAEVIRTTHCPNTCDPPEAAGGSPAPKMPPLPPPAASGSHQGVSLALEQNRRPLPTGYRWFHSPLCAFFACQSAELSQASNLPNQNKPANGSQ